MSETKKEKEEKNGEREERMRMRKIEESKWRVRNSPGQRLRIHVREPIVVQIVPSLRRGGGGQSQFVGFKNTNNASLRARREEARL